MKKFKVGLQLYSVREDMQKDMDATLKQVSEMGYECVEFAGYFGKTAQEVKEILELNKSERHIRGGMATKNKYLLKRINKH